MKSKTRLFGVVIGCLMVSTLTCHARRRWIPRIPSAAPSTLTFVQAKRARAFSGTTNPVAFDSAVTAGHLIAVGVTWDSTTVTLTSITDSLGNTYTLVGNPTSSITGRAAMSYVPNVLGGANTVTATFSGSISSVICVQEISGANASSPLDQSALNAQTNPGTGTDAVTSGTVTTTTAGQYIFGFSGDSNSGATFTQGTGFTAADVGNAGAAEYQVQGAAGSLAATFTISAGFAVTITGIMTFK